MGEQKSRSPHGERGLKFQTVHKEFKVIRSLPSRGAWIEILTYVIDPLCDQVAPLTGSVD